MISVSLSFLKVARATLLFTPLQTRHVVVLLIAAAPTPMAVEVTIMAAVKKINVTMEVTVATIEVTTVTTSTIEMTTVAQQH
jgi:hypothetical protein